MLTTGFNTVGLDAGTHGAKHQVDLRAAQPKQRARRRFHLCQRRLNPGPARGCSHRPSSARRARSPHLEWSRRSPRRRGGAPPEVHLGAPFVTSQVRCAFWRHLQPPTTEVKLARTTARPRKQSAADHTGSMPGAAGARRCSDRREEGSNVGRIRHGAVTRPSWTQPTGAGAGLASGAAQQTSSRRHVLIKEGRGSLNSSRGCRRPSMP